MIIGAGLGGASLAHGLKRAGFDVVVYERERSRADGRFGTRSVFGETARNALRTLLPEDLYLTFLATCAQRPDHLKICSERLVELFRTPLPATGWRGNAVFASPMTLRQIMLTGIEDVVHFDKELTHFEEHTDGRVTAYFTDGTHAVADLLVGADGARSRVRGQILPRTVPQPSALTIASGAANLAQVGAPPGGDRLTDGLTVVSDCRGVTLFLQALRFPWSSDGGLKEHVGDTDAALIDTWPGSRYDTTVDHLMWGLQAPRPLLPPDPAALTNLLRDWHPALAALPSLSDPTTVEVRPAAAAGAPLPAKPARTTLLGDARHFVDPDPGIGSTATVYAAERLCRLLTAARDGSLTDAVAEYERWMLGYYPEVRRAYSRCLSWESDPAVSMRRRTRLRFADHMPGVRRRVMDDYSWLDGIV